MLQFVAKRYVDSWSSWNYLEQAVICDSLRLCQINVNHNNIDLRSCIKQSIMNAPDDIIIDDSISPVVPMTKILSEERTQGNVFNLEELQQVMIKFGPCLKNMAYDSKVRLLRMITANR